MSHSDPAASPPYHRRMVGGRRIVAVAVGLLVVTGACGGGGKKDDKAEQKGVSDETTTSIVAGEGSTDAGTPGGAGATKPGSPGAAGGTTTTSPRSGASASGSGSTSSASPRFTAPGGYVYRRTGKQAVTGLGEQSLDGEGSLSVDPPAGDDQHTFLSYGESDASEQTLRSKPGSLELVHLKTITRAGTTTEFRPNPPVLFAPDPLAVGRTWSWRITSTDGSVTVDGSFKATRTEDLNVGGEQVATTVVEADLRFSGSITGTTKQTVWASPKYRLIVRTDEVTDLTSPFVVHSETSSVITSTKPR